MPLVACQTLRDEIHAGPHNMQGSLCILGDCNQGPGILQWPNNAYIKGIFKQGQLTGPAEFHFNGQRYVGEYRRGLIRQGQGPLVYGDGNWYLGDFQDGLRHGSGRVYSWAGALMFRGHWNLDRRTRTLFYVNGRPVQNGSRSGHSLLADRFSIPRMQSGEDDSDSDSDEEDESEFAHHAGECLDAAIEGCADSCIEAMIQAVIQVTIQAVCDAITK